VPDQHQDFLSILIDAAIEVRREHEPDIDGLCTNPDCREVNPSAVCRAYATAEQVLNEWGDEAYLEVTYPVRGCASDPSARALAASEPQ
jgi:hypothetical protein